MKSVKLFIQEHIRCGFLDLIFPNITHLGDKGLAWIALTILLLFFKKTRKAGIYSACALVLSLIINNEIICVLSDFLISHCSHLLSEGEAYILPVWHHQW